MEQIKEKGARSRGNGGGKLRPRALTVKLADFGDSKQNHSRSLVTWDKRGTPIYMAPEILDNWNQPPSAAPRLSNKVTTHTHTIL